MKFNHFVGQEFFRDPGPLAESADLGQGTAHLGKFDDTAVTFALDKPADGACEASRPAKEEASRRRAEGRGRGAQSAAAGDAAEVEAAELAAVADQLQARLDGAADDAAGDQLRDDLAARVGQVDRVVEDVARQVEVAGREAERVVTQELARRRVVVTRPVVVEARFGIALAPGTRARYR